MKNANDTLPKQIACICMRSTVCSLYINAPKIKRILVVIVNLFLVHIKNETKKSEAIVWKWMSKAVAAKAWHVCIYSWIETVVKRSTGNRFFYIFKCLSILSCIIQALFETLVLVYQFWKVTYSLLATEWFLTPSLFCFLSASFSLFLCRSLFLSPFNWLKML